MKTTAINKQRKDAAGDVIDALNHQIHKAGNLVELKIAAGLDEYTRLDDGDGNQTWKRFQVLILFIISLGLIIVSFLAYSQMLNVQESIDLLSPELSYEELVMMGQEIARSSAHWFYLSVASLVFAAVFLGTALAVVFFHSYR